MDFCSLTATRKGICCFALVCILAQIQASISHRCLAVSSQTYQSVVVPFRPTQSETEFRPHQLVTVNIQAGKFSLPVPATFLFDTGSTHCAISASLAAKLGLPLHPLRDSSGNPLKFNGKTAVGITVGQMDINGFQVKDVPINILPDEQLTQALGQPVDGILGADIWHSLAVQLDFTKNELSFIAPKNPVAYSDLAFTVTNLTPYDIRQIGFSKALVVPLLHDLYTYSALFELKNGTKTETQNLLIDTGTPDTAISKPVANLLGLEPAVKASYTALQNFNVNVSWLPSLHCGDLSTTNLLVASPSGYISGFVPRLGLDVLANYDVLFDFPHFKMYLKPRADMQAVTSRQYEAASSAQRQQWTQKRLILVYPTLVSYAVPYDLNGDSLPVAQVRSDWASSPVLFLLKSNVSNVLLPEAFAKKWGFKTETMLGSDGNPFLVHGQSVQTAKTAKFYVGAVEMGSESIVLPGDLWLQAASYQTVSGVLGANFCFARPTLMNPEAHLWLQIWKTLQPEDITSLGMASAAVLDILIPEDDGIPAVAVQVQQGVAQATDTLTLATGSPFTLLSAEAAKTLKLTPEPKKLSYGAGKDITVFNQAHLSQLSIGGVALKDVAVAYPIGAMPDGFYPRLGMNVISKLRLLVDVPGKKMYVKKTEK